MTTDLKARFDGIKKQGLKLDMTRGKPCPEQLDLSMGMLTADPGRYKSDSGTDCRNYGILDGLPSAKKLFAEILEVSSEEVIVGGNASLALMHDTMMRLMLRGAGDGAEPWCRLPQVKFLCPAPGYDRHFAICEYLGIEMVTVAMDGRGPDMAKVEDLAGADESVKGIICVPRYSNPTGITYSPSVVKRLANMKTAAKDFRIIWDDAYHVHHLVDDPEPLENILHACRRAGKPERVFMFSSTSKITFAGAGVGWMAASLRNVEYMRKQISWQTIGPDKINQMRHVAFLKDAAGVEAHMKKHRAILAPKFDLVQEVLERELGGKGVAEWSRPKGGYFVSLDVKKGCAKKVVAMAAEAGVKLTPAGATYPLKKDPEDRNIRIAPSFPSLDEIGKAMEVLCVCVQLANAA